MISNKNLIKKIPNSLYIFIPIFIIFSFLVRGFFSPNNVNNLFVQSSVLITISLGVTLIHISGGIDLSVGGVLTFSGVVVGLLLSNGYSFWWAILVGILTGSVFGFMNGVLIAKLKIYPFIVTFSMMGIALGLANTFSSRRAVYWGKNIFMDFIGTSTFMGFSILGWLAISFFIIILIILESTKLKPYIFAIGSNKESARLSGVNVNKCILSLYIFSGFMAAIGAIMIIARINCADPIIGVGYHFEAVVATVLGGTPLSGGKGSLIGTFFGALTVGMLRNGLSLMGYQTPWQLVIIGIVFLVGLFFNEIIQKKTQL